MNKVDSTLTAAEREALDVWCAEIREMHANLTAPIYADDPRMEAFNGSYIEGFTPEDLGGLYFLHAKNLPAWPLPLPSWAVGVEVLAGTYPEMTVRVYGKGWDFLKDDGTHFSPRIEQFGTIFADDDDDMAEGGTIKRGDFKIDAPKVMVPPHKEDLTTSDALALATSIEDAAMQLINFLDS